MVDCYIWYHEKLFRLARVNGTFYDNCGLYWGCDPDVGLGYVRDDGQAQASSNMYIRRQLSKRLNTLCWLLGQPPMFYPNYTTFDLSFKQKMICIEGEFYIWTADGTLFDGISMDTFRAQVLSRAQTIHLRTGHDGDPFKKPGYTEAYHYAGTSHKPVRSVLGFSLLFDIGCSRFMDKEYGDKILASLDKEIGLFHTERPAEFIPYWRGGEFVSFAAADAAGSFRKVKPEGVYVSLYRQPGKALLWLVNASGEDKTFDLWLDDQRLLGKAATSLRDQETDEKALRLKPDEKDSLQKDIWPHVHIPPRTFRALVLE